MSFYYKLNAYRSQADSNAATFASNVSILVRASCKAAVNKGTYFE